MAFAERLRDAGRPINVIGNAAPSDPVSPESRPLGEAAYLGEPESIARSYYVEQNGSERRYWQDYGRTNLVMRASATTVSSKREDLNTIRAMVDLAAARGWSSLELSGSAVFRREAWIEAQAKGLEAAGHRPSDPDRQEADRRRLERAPRNEQGKDNDARRASPSEGRRGAAELSPDGRMVLSAFEEKIERQMNRLNGEAKAKLRGFVAGELVRKERAEGPVVLSAEQRRAAAVPEPAQRAAEVSRRAEPEAPRRALGR